MPGTLAKKLRGLDGFFYFATGAPVVTTGSTSSTAATSTVTSAAGIVVGALVTGTGIPAGTTVVSISGTTITLSGDATATASGVTLTFTPVTGKLAHCAGWDLTVKADSVDATDHDSQGWKDKLDGLKEFSGTIDAMYFTNDPTQLSLIDAMLAGGVDITADFRPVVGSGEVAYVGVIRLTDFKTSAKGSTAQAVNLSFEGRGPLARSAQA